MNILGRIATTVLPLIGIALTPLSAATAEEVLERPPTTSSTSEIWDARSNWIYATEFNACTKDGHSVQATIGYIADKEDITSHYQATNPTAYYGQLDLKSTMAGISFMQQVSTKDLSEFSQTNLAAVLAKANADSAAHSPYNLTITPLVLKIQSSGCSMA